MLADTGVITLNPDGHHFLSVKGITGLTFAFVMPFAATVTVGFGPVPLRTAIEPSPAPIATLPASIAPGPYLLLAYQPFATTRSRVK